MSGYRHGVLIHNFNEDQFGLDLKTRGPAGGRAGPLQSIAHSSHDWKQPTVDEREPPTATSYVPRHLLFGHTGDMTDPHTNLQKSEFVTCTQYFYQAPKSVPVASLSAEKFAVGDEPLALPRAESTLADKIKQSWSSRPVQELSETFKSLNKSDFVGAKGGSLQGSDRFPRHYGEFSKGYDAVKLLRSS